MAVVHNKVDDLGKPVHLHRPMVLAEVVYTMIPIEHHYFLNQLTVQVAQVYPVHVIASAAGLEAPAAR